MKVERIEGEEMREEGSWEEVAEGSGYQEI